MQMSSVILSVRRALSTCASYWNGVLVRPHRKWSSLASSELLSTAVDAALGAMFLVFCSNLREVPSTVEMKMEAAPEGQHEP